MKRARGFSLIELLVVIAIIAILAAILFPIFLKARQRAKMSACISNLKQIGVAIQTYRDDHNGGFPLYLKDPDPTGSKWPESGRQHLERYTKNLKVFICPSDYTKGVVSTDHTSPIFSWEFFYNPAKKPVTSYAYHAGIAQLRTPAINSPDIPLNDAKNWLVQQTEKWQGRFIVAACCWHRHLDTRGALDSRIKDQSLRADGSVRTFIWPAKNWEIEPYQTSP